MAVQNPLYGRELSEGEAAIAYQPKSPILTVLSNPPANGDYLLSVGGTGTLTWKLPTTDLIPEGTARLYFTTARVKATITGAASTVVSADLTPSCVPITDSDGKLSVSTITVGELGYLSGVTSNIQGQLASINSALGSIGDIGSLTTSTVAEGANLYYTDSRARAAITGAVSPVLTTNLTASRLLVSDTGGKVSTSNVTTVEAGYLSGVTAPIQTQLAGIGTLSTTVANLTTTSVPEGNRLYFTAARAAASITGAASTVATADLPPSRALISDSNGKVATSPTTATELSYLAGTTSPLQGQIGTLSTTVAGLTTTAIAEGTNLYHTPGRVVSSLTGAVTTIATSDLTVSKALVSTASGKVGVSAVTSTELGYLAGVTSGVQAQFNTISTTINGLTTSSVAEGTANLYFTTQRAVAAITGASSTITTTNLAASKVLVSDASGKVSSTTTTTAEVGYVCGVTSPIQAQLNAITSRNISAGSGLTGGGTLSANLSLSVSFEGNPSTLKAAGTASVGTLATVPRADHVHPPDTTKVDVAILGVASGVATLDSNTKVPTSQIPTITTQVGFGGEVVSVPYTGTSITLPLPIAQGGTGTTNSASALSALGAQAAYPILTSLHMTAGGGFVVKGSDGLVAIRSMQANAPIVIANGSGTTNPTISITQGVGSGLDADLLDGLHGSSYLRTDGVIAYTGPSASTIRGSILAAGAGSNTDITSMGSVTALGNGSTSHVQIDSTGNVLVGRSTTTPNGGDVQVSRGLTFPSIQVPCSNPNTLDDYSEGTWTPSINSFTPGTGRVTTITTATYTKVGRVVYIHAYLTMGTLGTGGSGYVVVTGLPYPCMNQYSAVQVPYYANLKAATLGISAIIVPGTSYMYFLQAASSVTSTLLDFNTYIQANTSIIIAAHYFTA